MRHANGNCDIHTNTYTDSHSHSNSDSYIYPNAHSNCNADSYRDFNSFTLSVPDAFAQASTNTSAAAHSASPPDAPADAYRLPASYPATAPVEIHSRLVLLQSATL